MTLKSCCQAAIVRLKKHRVNGPGGARESMLDYQLDCSLIWKPWMRKDARPGSLFCPRRCARLLKEILKTDEEWMLWGCVHRAKALIWIAANLTQPLGILAPIAPCGTR